MKLSEIARVLATEAHIISDIDIEYLLTDSRTLNTPPAATLFFALRTAKDDGARYIPSLIAEGVRAFVLSSDSPLTEPSAGVALLRVENPLEALQQLAA